MRSIGGPQGRHDDRRSTFVGAAAVFAIALAAVIYALLNRYMLNDSFWIDVVWADQFADQIRAGHIYPRWLPSSHGGLGSPVFYFYPPIAFYGAAFFSLSGAPICEAVTLTFGAALLASGISMRLWLRELGVTSFTPVCLYMVMPYHLLDFYGRGALAEFTAYAVVPLLALGSKRAASGDGVLLLPAAYALIILTHLPSALLATLLLCVPYALILAKTDFGCLLRLASCGVLGMLLAGIYLIPMIALQPYASLASMTGDADFQTGSWSIFRVTEWPVPTAYFVGAALVSIGASSLVFLAFRVNSWLVASLSSLAVIVGLVPGLWELPLLRQIQFPWRGLVFTEFFLVTGIALAKPLSPIRIATGLLPILFGSLLAVSAVRSEKAEDLDSLLRRMPDVREYLPPEAPVPAQAHHWRTIMARNIDRAEPPDHRSTRQFYFPSWKVKCAGKETKVWADPRTGLLSWQGEQCHAAIGITLWEWLGLASSLAGLLLCLGGSRVRAGRCETREATDPPL